MNKKERFCDVDNIVEWRHIFTALLTLITLAGQAQEERTDTVVPKFLINGYFFREMPKLPDGRFCHLLCINGSKTDIEMKQLRTALSLARITQTFSIKSYIVHEPYKHWG